METIKWQTKAMHGCIAVGQSLLAGDNCGIVCTPAALSVTHSTNAAAVWKLWHLVSAVHLSLPFGMVWYVGTWAQCELYLTALTINTITYLIFNIWYFWLCFPSSSCW